VVERLVQAGVPVRAIVNPLRGVTADVAYVASAIKQIPGPVLVVGHSYGGVVITNAASRPVAGAALAEKTGVPAWKNLPAWSIVATGDKAAGTDVVRSTAQRAGATITELDGSHVIMISRPAAVTDVILAAVKAVSPNAAVPV
jgi:surfactin synthase thioesterase subunit